MPKIGQKIAKNEKMLIQGPVSHRDLARRSLLTSDLDSSPQNCIEKSYDTSIS